MKPKCLALSSRRSFLVHAGLLLTVPLSERADAALTTTFRLGTDTEEVSFFGTFLRLVYNEAFRRLGIKLEIVQAPLKRVSMMLEQDRLDGECARGPAYGLQHPELLEIDVELAAVVFAIYSMKTLSGIGNLKELVASQYRGISRQGVVFCEDLLNAEFPKDRLTTSPSLLNSVAMLNAGRADFFCDVSTAIFNAQVSSTDPDVKRIQKVFDLTKQISLKPYLHAKHAETAKLLTKTLKKMQKDGSFERFHAEALLKMELGAKRNKN